MAYQTRRREPLVDEGTAAALARRGREAIGLCLLAAGALLGAALWSYAPTDPGWFAAGGEVSNWLGAPGAAVASPAHVMLGRASLLAPLALLVWGLRFVLHAGASRALARTVTLPVALVAAAIHMASVPPGEGWTHGFGLGGHVGDTFLGAAIGVLPLALGTAFAILAVASAVLMVALSLHALGLDRGEARAAARFCAAGIARVGRSVASGVKALASRRRARSDAAEDDAAEEQGPPAPRRALGGLLPRRRAAEPEDAAEEAAPAAPPDDAEGRVRARITDAIRARTRAAAPGARAESQVRGGDGPAPPDFVAEAAARRRAAGRPPEAGAEPEPDAVIEAPEDEDDAPPAADEPPAPIEDAPPVLRRQAAPEAEMPPERPPAPAPRPSARPRAEIAPAQEDGAPAYELPPLGLLRDPATVTRHHLPDDALEENARLLESVLDDYGVKGEIVSVRPGPVVTMYELEPAPGLKASRVIGLADDIARSMSALSARVSTVPGRSVIGIELPNENREMCVLREILSTRAFGDGAARLPLALGKDIGGDPIVANLAKMPHLLIAGTTGSGKSVAINTMILSLLYRLTPEECRLIMIDPKMLELSVYDGIPHLLSPVVTDPKKAVVALKWVVGEMEDRYRKMSKMGVRNIDGYNGRVREALSRGELFTRTVQTGFDDDTGEPVFETEEIVPEALPYIVVVVDEMADLMMVAGKEIEACIQRLAQMARASGIHLIMATQRPSVDVITGTIKANFPTRISFQVTSKIDSRTILGEQGAEQLLGMGDMLYMAGGSKITRVHGPFCSDEEVEEIVSHLKSYGPPEYVGGVQDGPEEAGEGPSVDEMLGLGGNTGGEDALYDQAVAVVIRDRKCSTSYVQRKLGIGYNKAARLVEQMEDEGVVSASNHVGKREILVPEQA